jgi:hypothetical protein
MRAIHDPPYRPQKGKFCIIAARPVNKGSGMVQMSRAKWTSMKYGYARERQHAHDLPNSLGGRHGRGSEVVPISVVSHIDLTGGFGGILVDHHHTKSIGAEIIL